MTLGEVGVFQPLWINGADAGRAVLLKNLREETNWSTSVLIQHIHKAYKALFDDVMIENIQIVDMPWLIDLEWHKYLPKHQLFIPSIRCSFEFDLNKYYYAPTFVYIGEKINIDERGYIEEKEYWADGLTRGFINLWYKSDYIPQTDQEMISHYFGYPEGSENLLNDRMIEYIKENK